MNPRALDRLREAEALAERLNDDRRRGRVCAFMTNIHSMLGDLDEALVTGTRALEIAGRLGDLRLRILTTTYLGAGALPTGATTSGWSSWPPISSRHCPPTGARVFRSHRTGIDLRSLLAGHEPRCSSADSLRRPRTRRKCSGSPSRCSMRIAVGLGPWAAGRFTASRVTGQRRAH